MLAWEVKICLEILETSCHLCTEYSILFQLLYGEENVLDHGCFNAACRHGSHATHLQQWQACWISFGKSRRRWSPWQAYSCSSSGKFIHLLMYLHVLTYTYLESIGRWSQPHDACMMFFLTRTRPCDWLMSFERCSHSSLFATPVGFIVDRNISKLSNESVFAATGAYWYIWSFYNPAHLWIIPPTFE